MKLIFKILILCLIIFTLGIYITKKSIDYTFEKVQCSHIETVSTDLILNKIIEV